MLRGLVDTAVRALTATLNIRAYVLKAGREVTAAWILMNVCSIAALISAVRYNIKIIIEFYVISVSISRGRKHKPFLSFLLQFLLVSSYLSGILYR